jgi:hypothetical protein
MTNTSRHKNYESLNLIGYGLSKFNYDFVRAFGFEHKSQFYNYVVDMGIAETIGTVKNRQDLFDGMTSGGERKGWWQKGDIYKHRKDYIDSIFGALDVVEFVEVVKLSFAETLKSDNKKIKTIEIKASPIIRSKFKQMQETGKEGEYYFMNNYKHIAQFSEAKLDDARLLGDGYDFQLTSASGYYLAEVKGIRAAKGNIRMTKNEYEKAQDFQEQYALIIICNLEEIPHMVSIFNPLKIIDFEERLITTKQIYYQSATNEWK